MRDLPKELIDCINVINDYYKKYNINNYYFNSVVSKLKYTTNFNLDKYGMYDGYNNKMTINPNMPDDGKKVLSHELLHIAGGFNLHRGFNEFSTQYLNSVLFGAKKGHFEKNDFKMMDKLVNVVGFDYFFKCYLLRNFDLFMEELLKHYEFRDAHSIINIFDKYYSWFTNLESRSGLNKSLLEREFKELIKSKLK